MRVLCGTILAVGWAALAAVAWTPGDEYAAGGTTRTNAVYDPFTGNILPVNANVTVIGRIRTNDVAVFTDRSGKFVRGTNLLEQVQGWTTAATTGLTARVTAVEAGVTAVSNAVSAETAARVAGVTAVSNSVAAAVAGLASTQQLSAAVATLVSTGQLSAALAALPPGSADALRLVDNTNSPAQWIDGLGNVWTNYPTTRVSYRKTDSWPNTYNGESWGFSSTVGVMTTYTNGTRPVLTFEASELAENGGYWQMDFNTGPYFGSDAAGDAATLYLTNGNEGDELNFERQEVQTGTVVMIVDHVARSSDLESLPPSGLTEQQVTALVTNTAFSSIRLSSAYTNTLLKLYWDSTNGTIVAQEVLP